MTEEPSGGPGHEAGEGVLVHLDEFGILVQGHEDVAARVIDRLLSSVGTAAGPDSRVPLSDLAAVGATGAALAASSGEYLRLTADSLAKVKELGAQLDGSGALRGYVRDGGGKFAGQLAFEPVSLAAEQALALQTAAVSLALRSAIADVQKAVERVEGKVDKINRHLDSRLRGDVIGTYRHLTQVVSATNSRGHLLEADWDSVAGVRGQVSRDLDTMRAFVTSSMQEVSRDLSVPKREAHFRAFHEDAGNVGDVLELILVAEQSLHSFEYLRLQHVRHREPQHVTSAVADARSSLLTQQRLDEQLVETIVAAVERGRMVEPLEIHRVFSKKGLDQHARILHERARDFAVATRSTPPPALAAIAEPTLAEAREEVRTRSGEAAQVARAVGSTAVQGGAAAVRAGSSRFRGAVAARVPRRPRSAESETSTGEPTGLREHEE